jgi:hypothetical protein
VRAIAPVNVVLFHTDCFCRHLVTDHDDDVQIKLQGTVGQLEVAVVCTRGALVHYLLAHW